MLPPAIASASPIRIPRPEDLRAPSVSGGWSFIAFSSFLAEPILGDFAVLERFGLGGVQAPPAAAKVSRGFWPGRKLEGESACKESPGHHSAALQDELGFRLEKIGADLEHPLRRGQADWGTPCAAQCSHELRVGDRIGGREVHRALDFLVVDQPEDRSEEVLEVNPRDILSAV